MKSQKMKYAVAALLPLFAINARAVVGIAVNGSGAGNVIRTDITRTIFGSGIEHTCYSFDDDAGHMMDPTISGNATRAYMQSTLGTMRFPHGTTGLYYLWNRPQNSENIGTLNPYKVLTDDEMLDYTAASKLNMERIFEVNTYRCISNDGFTKTYIMNSQTAPNPPYFTINPASLVTLANSAAAWVTDNLSLPASQRVHYWEVGNEDWDKWNALEYRDIFNKFAEKMELADPTIKLVAQSYTGVKNLADKPPGAPAQNTNTWLQSMLTPSSGSPLDTSNLHAISEHEYLSTKTYPADTPAVAREKQARDMFAIVANDTRIPFLKGVLAANGLADRKVWMTEFNTWPQNPQGGDASFRLQDVAHGVVIADWMGRLLEQKTDKIMLHGHDTNPFFSAINYLNDGGTVTAPRITVPGHAWAKIVQEFGPKMVKNTITGNSSLTPADGTLLAYPKIAAYSVVRESDLTMRVMVINRSESASENISITTVSRPMSGPSRNYSYQTLTSTNLTDNNTTVNNYVNWSTPVVAASNTTAITATVPKMSVTFFIIPLQ